MCYISLACGELELPGMASATSAAQRSKEMKKTAWLHEVYLREASGYEFFLDEEKRRELELPGRAGDALDECQRLQRRGLCLDESRRGRDCRLHLLGAARQADRVIMHEFHSLVPHALYAGKRGGSGWLPQAPGIQLEPIADAPVPAKDPARRLVQMRDLSRRFTSQVFRENSKWEMRLLTQPIYRYEITDETKFADCRRGHLRVCLDSRNRPGGTACPGSPSHEGQGSPVVLCALRPTNCEAWLKYRGKQVWR